MALIVKASPDVDQYIKDVILVHVAGVAVLTLLINAPTTGHLVRFLKLTEKTDVQKQMLDCMYTKIRLLYVYNKIIIIVHPININYCPYN